MINNIIINSIASRLNIPPHIVKQVSSIISQKGNNPKELENYVCNLCKSQNLDIETTIKQASSLMHQLGLMK